MTSQPRARTRSVEEMRALGRTAAEVLRAGGYQIAAAVKIGVPERTYYEWLNGEDEGALAFQAEVLPAYEHAAREAEEQAEKDIFGGEMHSSPAVSWYRWKLEKRYPKVFGAARLEVSGPNGGPIESRDLSNAKDSELLGLLATTKDVPDGSE